MRTLILVLALSLTALPGVAQDKQTPEEYLAGVEKRFAAELLPRALRLPMTIEEADSFVAGIRHFREAGPKELPKIEAIEGGPNTRLKSDKQRLAHWVGKEIPRRLDEALQQTRQAIDGSLQSKASFVKFAADIDLKDTDKVRNVLAKPEAIEERETAVRELLQCADLLQRIDEQMGEKTDWPAKRKELDAMVARFREKVAGAAAQITPPKDIGDAKLTEIAQTTLKDPKYGAKEWKRLIVNSPKQHKAFVTYEMRGNEILRCSYDYDIFQATTIEKEGNDWFLFYNQLAFYNSGAPTTPLSKWVVRERFRGPRILEANIAK